ncbi:hypothetical protein LP420_15220 [Massilia sp. B-10]|nr:hypothetical protein LP420_15220 [Massilia sp. B-10]
MSALPGQDLEVQLEDMRMRADPLADNTIATLLGPWTNLLQAAHGDNANWATLDFINAQMAQWQSNGGLDAWKVALPGDDDAHARTESLCPGRRQPARLGRHGAHRTGRKAVHGLRHAVLHAAVLFQPARMLCHPRPGRRAARGLSQLEAHTEYRIRATAAMIFPVMMIGGLTRPEGGGLPAGAQGAPDPRHDPAT